MWTIAPMKELLIALSVQMNWGTFKIMGIPAPIEELIIEQKTLPKKLGAEHQTVNGNSALMM